MNTRKTNEDVVRENLDTLNYQYLKEVLEFCVNNTEKTKWDAQTTKQAFEYYNAIFTFNKQTGLWCSSCRNKVNTGLKKLIQLIPEHIYTLGEEDTIKEKIGETYPLLSIIKIRELLGL